ncbi:META domain-containing protein [Sulfitobacter sp. EhC04]|uniref:META domain-containing protein n=1 Tax=Sulfitobacter sp. EhC04 TaxID=1849168 RepID=UPI000A48410E|nr:META domain-containing protein [Sulfitobacter sp. EhC04]
MMMRYFPLVALLALAACDSDETLRAHGAADKEWRLVELQDAPFTATATLTFPEQGVVTGQGPCNSFSTTNTVPYPWFDAGPVIATRRACPDLAAESAYFTLLEAATLSEVLGNTLTLSDDSGVLLTFKADD